MVGCKGRLGLEPDCNWVDSVLTGVVSYYQSVDQLNEILVGSSWVLGLRRSKGVEKGV